MRKSFWTWALPTLAVILLSTYSVLNYLNRHGVSATASSPVQVPVSEGVDGHVVYSGNPLLTADKPAVSRWFPGSCFAELYISEPSFGGRLVPDCVVRVIKQVKDETGITLTEQEVRSPEVLAHFKSVYGPSAAWRQ